MTSAPTRWSTTELLADDIGLEPLVVGGRRCHGGLDDSGRYRSPRTRFSTTAIRSWQDAHREHFGTELLDAGLSSWPPSTPNVAQSRFLLKLGIREPVISALTRIGTVEGFGGAMRMWTVDDLQAHFVESIADTTLDHLPAMFEAQARDEAGWGEELGHRDMWFVARDIAFESPPVEDLTDQMLFRLGVTSAPGARLPTAEESRRRQRALARFPDLDLELESMIARMVNLLLVEISAAHTFAWAEELLADGELVAGHGDAARLVAYIRQDESPHVEYLRTALSEMRDRTFRGPDGVVRPGSEVVGAIWDRGFTDSTGARRENALRLARAELEDAIAGRSDRDDVLAGYERLGDPRGRDRTA
jgi:hypothetical protein